jgi:hypothetical protein
MIRNLLQDRFFFEARAIFRVSKHPHSQNRAPTYDRENNTKLCMGKKNMEIKRNKEFYRPFWDTIDSKERFQTTSGMANIDLGLFYARIRENKYDSADTISLTGTNASRAKSSEDNISCLFSYPQFNWDISTSHGSFGHGRAFDDAKRSLDRRYFIKRNMYSDYNEQRIKFGLKF